MDLRELKFRGTQVAYYAVCQRKLWLFTKGISFENESEYVQLGKLLDEISFSREREEEFSYEPVSIDFFTTEKGLAVHEVKHSPALEPAHVLQVKYYIYYLRTKGIKVSHGIIHYPKQKRLLEVELSKQDEELMGEVIGKMENILKKDTPPKVINKPYCKKCAYWEYCYG
ncbi:CRISPR-associated protein Cas4 [Thermocrinis sp.]|uniref:CRISPR-associated protein Cas4 n=1 Tax=Thermocrinis sp. TaxID=2024383 RepID=UPI002FDDFE4D